VAYPVRRLTNLGCVLGLAYLGCVRARPEQPKASAPPAKPSAAAKPPVLQPVASLFKPAAGAPAMPGVNVPAIKVDTVGYPVGWRKLAIFNVEPSGALLRDAQGQVAYTVVAKDIKARGRDES
jgi:hypothetical protein